MKRLVAFLTVLIALALPGIAHAEAKPPKSYSQRQAIHFYVQRVHKDDRLLGIWHPYGGFPKQAPWPHPYAAWVIGLWRGRWHADKAKLAATGGLPAYFVADMVCIGDHEESGQNSVAGRYGFIYPPSTYGGIAATLAGTYGESWLAWPQVAQLEVAYMLYREYGWSPWSTAPGCGL